MREKKNNLWFFCRKSAVSEAKVCGFRNKSLRFPKQKSAVSDAKVGGFYLEKHTKKIDCLTTTNL